MANTLKNRAYEHLRQEIFSGALPPGTQLRSTQLAASLGMSMIPVREAIQQLAGDGLVEHRPHTGAFVRRLDHAEIEELLRLRAGLDCIAAPEAALRALPEHLAGMAQACAELREVAREAHAKGRKATIEQVLPLWLRASEADYSLHIWIVRAAGNRYLLKTYQEHQVISRAMRATRFHIAVDSPHVLTQLYLGHARIYRAIRRRNPERALDLMRYHWSASQGINPLRPIGPLPGYVSIDLPVEHQWIYRRVEELERGR